MNYARQGDEESQLPSAWHDDMGASFKESCTSLSPKQRLWGFMISGCTGAVLLLLAVVRLRPNNLVPFAVLYSLGSLCLIGATMFLIGPMRQLRQMLHHYRWATTVTYIFLIVLTLVVALCDGLNNALRVLLCFILVALQFFAACWYALSYIPYARKAAGKVCSKRSDCESQ